MRRSIGSRRRGPAAPGGRLAAVLLAGVLGLAACGGDSQDSAGGGASPSGGGGGGGGGGSEEVRVGLAYDIGGRGDQSFNDSAAQGLDRASSELGVMTEELSPNQEGTDRGDNLRLLAEQGFNPVIAVGFAYAESLGDIAAEFPETQFGIVDDQSVTGENITNLVFAEEEGSFLVGAAAALEGQGDSVGFVGGVQVPLIEKFEAGYTAGVQQVEPETTVEVRYLTQPPDFAGFTSPELGRTAAEGLLDGGADVIFAAAGGSGAGVFQAVQAAGASAIGVDSDQYQSVSPPLNEVIITSMIKRVDVAVFEFVQSVVEGDPLTGVQMFDLARDGVGYATSGGQIDDIVPRLEELEQQIIDGEIEVPTTPQG